MKWVGCGEVKNLTSVFVSSFNIVMAAWNEQLLHGNLYNITFYVPIQI